LIDKVSIIIPTLNEEYGIQKTIQSIPMRELVAQGYDVEILVIDGCSADSTQNVGYTMGAKVIVESKRGYGRAYKTGFEAAKGDIIVTLDADGTYPAKDILGYLRKLKENDLDFITINRFTWMEKNAMSLSHKVGNKILSAFMRILYSIDIKDSQSGMWIMKRSFIESVKLNSDDMSLSEEIKIIAFRYFKSLEADGKYYKRIGEAKLETFSHGLTNLKYLFQYRKTARFAILPPASQAPIDKLDKQNIHLSVKPNVERVRN
jgi:glycosyltransferase involved in cell wall biosynthesis